MKKYKIAIIAGIIIIILLVGIIIGFKRQKPIHTSNLSKTSESNIPTDQGYQIRDTSSSPKSSEEVMQGEIMRETEPNDPSFQRFVFKSAVDGSIRQLLAIDGKNITFENIQPQNWSPSDRFLYIYVDYPNRRDVIFLKTDGTFTNGQFYLHSTGLYPDMNVISANWIDETTLELQTTDIKTQKPLTYIADFDDDTGSVTQCPGGPSTCDIDGN